MNEENMNAAEAGAHKMYIDYVASDKTQETIVVELEGRKQHALHGKTIRTNSKIEAYDENEEAGTDGRVRIEECRPLFEDKHYRLIETVEKTE